MKRALKLTTLVLAGACLTGFDGADPWAGLEGEWAHETEANCGGANSVAFTYDYRRDQNGDLIFPNDRPPSRRDRLARVTVDGDMAYLANVSRRVTLSGDGSTLSLRVRRPALLPFRGFSDLSFRIEDENTLTEETATGDGDALMRAMGGAPVRLVRCSAEDE